MVNRATTIDIKVGVRLIKFKEKSSSIDVGGQDEKN